MTGPQNVLRFTVSGKPAPQGSMTAVYNARLGVARVRHVAAPALSLWRNAVANAARDAGAREWNGPIGINIHFAIKAPLMKAHGYPKQPDLDKLVRAVMDALTGVCYHDDSQVVSIVARKSWTAITEVEVWREGQQVAAIWQTATTETSTRMGKDETTRDSEGSWDLPPLRKDRSG